MTYHAVVSKEGTVPLPEEIADALGIRAGDKISIDRSGSRIVLMRDNGRGAAISRLRSAFGDYSVERFLEERKTDSGE